ncbi:hypothetical protein LF63_0105255 [Oleiagrimonas soli]|nr:hypothetical protein LF63_0105255 [Oleiagrimonas soli]
MLFVVLTASSCQGGVLNGTQHGQEMSQAKPSATAQEAAQAGLVTLRQLITEQNYRGMGFSSLDEVKEAALDRPMEIYIVRLDALKKYRRQSGADLLTDEHKMFYPLTARQRVVSSLAVTQYGGGWGATDFGSAALARAFSQYRGEEGDFIVRVPALKTYFVGHRRDGGLLLTPIIDDARFEFRAGKAMPAEQVFVVLQRAAVTLNTDAPN